MDYDYTVTVDNIDARAMHLWGFNSVVAWA